MLDEEGRLAGIIALDDVRDKRINGEHGVLVEDAMSSQVFTHHACTLSEALALMAEHDIHHLPVVPAEDPRALSGFVTRTDIMKADIRIMGRGAPRLESGEESAPSISAYTFTPAGYPLCREALTT